MSALGDEVMTSRQGYVVVLERGPTSWGAFVPGLPECVAVAETREHVALAIEVAITQQLVGMRQHELPEAPYADRTGEQLERLRDAGGVRVGP